MQLTLLGRLLAALGLGLASKYSAPGSGGTAPAPAQQPLLPNGPQPAQSISTHPQGGGPDIAPLGLVTAGASAAAGAAGLVGGAAAAIALPVALVVGGIAAPTQLDNALTGLDDHILTPIFGSGMMSAADYDAARLQDLQRIGAHQLADGTWVTDVTGATVVYRALQTGINTFDITQIVPYAALPPAAVPTSDDYTTSANALALRDLVYGNFQAGMPEQTAIRSKEVER